MPAARERTRFFGRTDELERLRDLFDAGQQLVTIVGAPGVGKTRLARRFAEGADALLVDATTARGGEELVPLMASALSLAGEPLPGDSATARVARALEDRAALFILDNMEHLAAGGARIIASWVDAAPAARFLVTSRERLKVHGESCLELRSLSQ